MTKAILGVAPVDEDETNVMSVFCSMSANALACLLGRVYQIAVPIGPFNITLGKAISVAMIPVALPLFLWNLAPFVCLRFTITNRRVVVQRGWTAQDERSVAFERFDSVEIEVFPGQDWYDAGDLVFKQGATETFRLQAVPYPDVFRSTIMKSRNSYVGVQAALAAQTA